MLETKVFAYEDSTYKLTVTVKEANVADGIKFTAMVTQAGMIEKEEDWLTAVYRIRTFPALICGTQCIEGEPPVSLEMTFDEFLELPHALIQLWEEAVFELNPLWSPFSLRTNPTGTGSTNAPSTG